MLTAPLDTSSTSRPALRRRATLSTRSISRSTARVTPSRVTTWVPSLMTIRCASARELRSISISDGASGEIYLNPPAGSSRWRFAANGGQNWAHGGQAQTAGGGCWSGTATRQAPCWPSTSTARRGDLVPAGETATGSSTSFLAVHPGGRVLYLTHNRANQRQRLADRLQRGAGTAGPGRRPGARPAKRDAGPAYADRGRHRPLAAGRQLPGPQRGGVRPGRRRPPGPAGRQRRRRQTRPLRSASARHHAFAFVPYLGSDHVAQYRFDPPHRRA